MSVKSLFDSQSNSTKESAKEGRDKMSTLFSMKKNSLSILCALVLVLSFNLIPAAADGIFEVESFVRITDVEGSSSETFLASEFFGNAAANIGDLDGDGITDLAVGAQLDDTGGLNKGALLILFMNANGTAGSYQKISDAEGGMSGVLANGDMFGCSVADIGDFDGDGTTDLAVGACGGEGEIYILFMNTDGTVNSFQKITEGVGGFTGVLFSSDNFGVSVANIGDLDGDGVIDIAVGAAQAKTLSGYPNGYRGAVWILFMKTDGTVKSHQKITYEEGGFGGVLNSNARFGSGIANMGDLDGDGTTDLAVGAQWLHDGANYAGAVFILFMNANGTVNAFQKISNTQGGLGAVLSEGDSFGFSVANMGDLDGDGNTDLAVGAYRDSTVRGAVYILLLNANGTVNVFQKLPTPGSSLDGVLTEYAQWGTSVASMGDLDGNGSTDLAVGARQPGTGMNGVYILFAAAVDSEGPITSNVVAAPNPVAMNGEVMVTANVDDTNTGGSNIASAEYSLDDGASWEPMDAQVGDFDAVSEDVIATFFAPADAGIYALCVRGTDAAGNVGSETCITLSVNAPPSVNAGGPYAGNEGSPISLAGFVDDPDGPSLTTTWTYVPVANVDEGAICEFGDANALATTFTCTDDGTYRVTLTGDDGINSPVEASADVTVYNVAPEVTITSPATGDLFMVNTAVDLLALFTDAGINDTHTCQVVWDDGTPDAATCTASHAYGAAGVYTILVTVTDDDGALTTQSAMVVVYDPEGGFVTGGGWIWSMPGAYTADPELEGKATFGFVSKYKKGTQTPEGQTEFVFKVADLNFHSSSYDWLVVAGPHAKFKGVGTINGSGEYGFMLTATDGNVNGGGGVDGFRIKIWDKANGDTVVYDNKMGQGDDSNDTTALGGGSIVVHKR